MNVADTSEPIIALGLMSGTSLDGVDAALIETDGKHVTDIGLSLTVPYSDEFRARLIAEVDKAGNRSRPTNNAGLERVLTGHHIETVKQLLNQVSPQSKWAKPTVIGFHGHTILHCPDRGFTQQIGDAKQLAESFQTLVISDFRSPDVSAGGQGAPLAPVFHAAMFCNRLKPLAVVNVGGISNITWIGNSIDELIAFDTGPGNGLLDRWIEEKTGDRYDKNGQISAQGIARASIVESWLEHPFFERPWPKSLDRSEFDLKPIEKLDTAEGAATLVDFAVKCIVLGVRECPTIPTALYVTGGGRRNQFLMSQLIIACPCPVFPVEDYHWDGDFVEAQAFAYMAVRSLRGLPITFPGTTGIKSPMTGGMLTNPV